jgi:DNA-binding NarL/FixJ family response regulator
MTAPASPSAPATAPQRLRLLLVDDHAVVRGGLEAMLAAVPEVEAVATAADGNEALHSCATFHPHVVLLDLRMPGMDGHSALEAIVQKWPDIRVVVLTGNDSPANAKLARREGAAGFLSKSADPATVLRVIREVAAGGTHFPETTSANSQDDAGLSARELEVLRYVVRGLTNDDIGLALGVSGQTIKGHLKHIFQKLEAATRAEATTRAHELGLV